MGCVFIAAAARPSNERCYHSC